MFDKPTFDDEYVSARADGQIKMSNRREALPDVDERTARLYAENFLYYKYDRRMTSEGRKNGARFSAETGNHARNVCLNVYNIVYKRNDAGRRHD